MKLPRTTSTASSNGRGRRRTTRGTSGANSVVTQIAQLVATNEALQRQNREVADENVRLRAELADIGTALGRLTGAPRGRRGRGGADALALPEAKPRRQRKPITDPEQLQRRRQALAKARAARSEKLAAARAAATPAE